MTLILRAYSPSQAVQSIGSIASFASSFTPVPQKEQDELLEFVAPYARQLMHYKP